MTADIIVDSNGKQSFVTRGSVSGEITIPDGYKAIIKGNKITFQKKESEDEKTRKKIVAIFKAITDCDEKEREEILNWLEKHKEDYSGFLDEQRKYMEKYIPLDKVTLVKLLAERDQTTSEILSGLSEIEITSLKAIRWDGNNLKDVIEFTGKYKMFDEWFKSFEDYENYVHAHNDIFKLFNEDGTDIKVPVGAWIIKTPDGHNIPSKVIRKPLFKWGDIEQSTFDEIIKDYESPSAAIFDAWVSKAKFLKKIRNGEYDFPKENSTKRHIYSKSDENFINDCIQILKAHGFGLNAERLLSLFQYTELNDEDKKKLEDVFNIIKCCEEDLNKKYLEGYSKGCLDGYKLALESTSYHTPYIIPCYAPDGICTNPQMDCINCPKQSSARDFITNISVAEK